jgi:hypothetical protein
VLVPAVMSAYAVVGEREQGTLEPLLTTPVTRAELIIGKAAAIFMPAAALGYLIFCVFFAITQLAAASPVAAAVRHAPQLPAALVFIPLLSSWAIWAGLAISTRVTDTRVAQQLAVLGSLPPVALAALMSFQVITPHLGPGRRPGRRLARGRLRRLPGGGPAVRPRAPHHRDQAQPRHPRTGRAAGHPVPRRNDGLPERRIKMSGTLRVTQESSLNTAGIMRGTFDVVVDGKSAGPIKWHSHRTVAALHAGDPGGRTCRPVRLLGGRRARAGRARARPGHPDPPRGVLIAKALAAFVPTLVIACNLFGIFLAAAALFAHPVIAPAIYAGTHVLVQLLLTPLLAGWAIWVGIAVCARSADVRDAQQLGMLGSLPPLVIVALMSLNVITESTALALGLAAALLVFDLLAWRVVATMFVRERLVTGRPG